MDLLEIEKEKLPGTWNSCKTRNIVVTSGNGHDFIEDIHASFDTLLFSLLRIYMHKKLK